MYRKRETGKNLKSEYSTEKKNVLVDNLRIRNDDYKIYNRKKRLYI